MVTHPPRAFPWEIKPPVGVDHVTGNRHRRTRGRRPRPRICLRKGCKRKYQPRCHNQRYCQDLECLRKVRRWHAARRKAKHRENADVRAKYAHAEKARRQRARSSSQTVENPQIAPARGHAAQTFFPLPVCERPGCHEHSVRSHRNQARYCCPACRQAVRNVLDRERKWRSRGTLAGRKKRAIEYQAARRAPRPATRRSVQSTTVPAASCLTVPRELRRSSIIDSHRARRFAGVRRWRINH